MFRLRSLNITMPNWTTSNLSLVGGSMCSLCGGIVYAFSLYGPQLATKLNFTSLQTNLIAVFGNLGIFVSTPLFGYLADTRPPSIVALYAVVAYLVGFNLLAWTYEGVLPNFGFFVVASYYFLVGTAGGCAYISATTTTGHNFKHRRGFGIGLPVTFFGISAFVFAQFYHFLFVGSDGVPNTAGFIRFLGWSAATLTLIGSQLLKKVVYEPIQERGSTVDDANGLESNMQPSGLTCSTDSLELEIGGWDLFYNWDARCLFLIIFIIGGSGIMYINNVGTILSTLLQFENLPQTDLPKLQATNVSVISLFNCLGRVIFSMFSDKLASSHYQIKRINFLLLSGLVLALASLSVTWFRSDRVFIASATIGMGYGFMFAVAPTITSIWFGTLAFGANWGWLNLGPAIGGQILSLTFGAIYDYHLIEDELICKFGPVCFASTFLITTFSSLLAAGLTYHLMSRRNREP